MYRDVFVRLKVMFSFWHKNETLGMQGAPSQPAWPKRLLLHATHTYVFILSPSANALYDCHSEIVDLFIFIYY